MNSVKIQSSLSESDFRAKESYKALRTNLQLCGSDYKVIAVTSSLPDEGKSTVSLNLATALAESGKKVLLIDADLRKSVLVGRIQMEKGTKGLTHYLSGQCPFAEIVCTTNFPQMHLILAGPVAPNPSELLGNKYFKHLIKGVREIYDYVIVDTPPLGSVIDSVVAAQECDGIVLVVAANQTSRKLVQAITSQLQNSNCHLLGIILNKIPMKKNSYYGKYYGKYYEKYYGNSNKK